MSASNKHSVDAAVFRIDAAPFTPISVPRPHCLGDTSSAPQETTPESEPEVVGPEEKTTAEIPPAAPSAVVAETAVWPPEEVAEEPQPAQHIPFPAQELEVDDEVQELEEVLSGNLAAAPLSAPEPPASAPVAAPMKPVWEVDRFRWPSLADRLLKEEEDYFGHAGQKLMEASQQGLKTLAVTASAAGEGCTTLAICLARAAAKTGARVALLDADLQNRQLATGLGLELSHGWLDVISGQIPWCEAAVNSLQDGLAVVPATPLSDRSPATPEAGAPEVLSQIAEHFDLLVIDLGQFSPDAWHLLGDHDCVANAAIVVRDRRSTSEAETMAVASKLRRCGVQAVGIAENFSGQRQPAAA